METKGAYPSSYGLNNHGLRNLRTAYWNLSSAALIERAIRRGEGEMTYRGSLLCLTGERTGRSPKDKFIVQSDPSNTLINWNKFNVATTREKFNSLHSDMMTYLYGKDVFVRDCFVGADPDYRMPIRVITEYAWHNLFALNMFIRPAWGSTLNHVPEFTIISVPDFHADPRRQGLNSEAFIMIDFEQKMVLIGGTQYAGEIKKSVFTLLNHLLPQRDVLPMHCSANVGHHGDVALFFGLSGTGKTTLSADPRRPLIGDDEHGWSPNGIYNFEGGCYAKCIRLTEEHEPQIYRALKFGSILENVVIQRGTRMPDFNDESITENTRAAYPIDFIDNAVHESYAGHPKHVVFLTCDASGVLPPIAKLSHEQAMYHFLSGYTAKVAGTEAGITEPTVTFSMLFGAPFFTQRPMVYAQLLGERIRQHRAHCWLVNTGWTGGSFGVGQRMSLKHTRALLNAALDDQLRDVAFQADEIFGLQIPQSCPNVPSEILNPRNTWSNPAAYNEKARHLAGLFRDNFKQFTDVTREVAAAGPKI
ncbi:MAG: Phosphoenolpyruvate carboxykinase (ATP) [Phycisphaerae bacterium]|nr:Phosphoenolpyruvate carboxykinase (ATP) [Phycisphaerae bacterium]